MSKAVTNEEVEDVLSSIRRLVSEDKRPLAGLRNAGGAPSFPEQDARAVTSQEDRLVLTPALRITESQDQSDHSDTVQDGPLDLGAVARQTWSAPDPAQDAQTSQPRAEQIETSDIDVDTADGTDATDEEADTIKPADLGALQALIKNSVQDASPISDQNTNSGQNTTLQATDDLVDEDYSDESYWQSEDDFVYGETTLNAAPPARTVQEPSEASAQDKASDDTSPEDDQPEEAAVAVEDPASERTSETLKTDGPERDAEDNKDPHVELGKVETDEAALSTMPAKPREDETDRFTTAPVSLTAKIAALEAAMGKIKTDWDADGEDSEQLAPKSSPAMQWEDDMELDARGAPLRAARSSMPARAKEVEEIDTNADLEAQHQDQPSLEAMPPEADLIGSLRTDGLDDAVSRDDDAPVDTATDVTTAPALNSDEDRSDDQLMDEEALRALVSSVVREELQGALGERITRNVRKLVRREIHRALTAQDLD